MVILAACLAGCGVDRARPRRRRRRAHRLRGRGQGAADLLPAVLRLGSAGGRRSPPRSRTGALASLAPDRRCSGRSASSHTCATGSRSPPAAGRSARATRASTPWSIGSTRHDAIVLGRGAEAAHAPRTTRWSRRSSTGCSRWSRSLFVLARARRGGRGAATARRRHDRDRDRALRDRAVRAARLEALLRVPAARTVRALARRRSAAATTCRRAVAPAPRVDARRCRTC